MTRILDVKQYNPIGQTIQGHYRRDDLRSVRRWYNGLGTYIVGGQAVTRAGENSVGIAVVAGKAVERRAGS